MNKFDTLVMEQLSELDESWKDTAKKYATGAALGAAGLLGLQHADSFKPAHSQQAPTKITQSGLPSKPNINVKSKHNINEYKTGLMARFHNTEITAGNYKGPTTGNYKYTVMKELGGMVKIYDLNNDPVITIKFSKDGGNITNIIKKSNVRYPEKMKSYIKTQFGVDL
jgi:hypothetical protein